MLNYVEFVRLPRNKLYTRTNTAFHQIRCWEHNERLAQDSDQGCNLKSHDHPLWNRWLGGPRAVWRMINYDWGVTHETLLWKRSLRQSDYITPTDSEAAPRSVNIVKTTYLPTRQWRNILSISLIVPTCWYNKRPCQFLIFHFSFSYNPLQKKCYLTCYL